MFVVASQTAQIIHERFRAFYEASQEIGNPLEDMDSFWAADTFGGAENVTVFCSCIHPPSG